MAASIDQQFIEYIVKSLVGDPDAVKVERTIDEKGVLLELTVAADDLGRVIGKRGATAQSLRTLLRALGTKNDARYNLKIVDVGEPPAKRSPAKSETKAAEPEPETPVEETPPPEAEPEPAAQEETATQNDSSDLASRTRAELADLDDLDV